MDHISRHSGLTNGVRWGGVQAGNLVDFDEMYRIKSEVTKIAIS